MHMHVCSYIYIQHIGQFIDVCLHIDIDMDNNTDIDVDVDGDVDIHVNVEVDIETDIEVNMWHGQNAFCGICLAGIRIMGIIASMIWGESLNHGSCHLDYD